MSDTLYLADLPDSPSKLQEDLNWIEKFRFKRVINVSAATNAEGNDARVMIEYEDDEKSAANNKVSPIEVRIDGVPAGGQTEEWVAFITPISFTHELIAWSKIVMADGQKNWLVVLRKRKDPIVWNQQSGFLTTQVEGWEWLKPKIVGDNLIVDAFINGGVEEPGAKVTWFGGPNDPGDNGETASGLVNTRKDTSFKGCSLPMHGFKKSPATWGSPLPRFKWGTQVEVECMEQDLAGAKITVPLVDLGPAKKTMKALDLTEPAFNELGATSSRGVIRARFRIQNWKQQLDPRAEYSFVQDTSSRNSHFDAASGEKVHPPQVFTGWDVTSFRAFYDSLKLDQLNHVNPLFFDDMVRYFDRANGKVRNSPPLAALWNNFAPALLVLNRLAASTGSKIYVTSSYRSKAYNDSLNGSADLSQHIAFRAADIQVQGQTPKAVLAFLQGLRGTAIVIPKGAIFHAASMTNDEEGINTDTPFNKAGLKIVDPTAATDGSFVFRGGLGLYSNFVHVDCRGRDANWP